MSEHICNPQSCPDGNDYFVTAMDGPRLHYMAGPYPSHALALAMVNEALRIADKRDGRAWFMSWGTVSLPAGSGKVGSINKAGLL